MSKGEGRGWPLNKGCENEEVAYEGRIRRGGGGDTAGVKGKGMRRDVKWN